MQLERNDSSIIYKEYAVRLTAGFSSAKIEARGRDNIFKVLNRLLRRKKLPSEVTINDWDKW